MAELPAPVTEAGYVNGLGDAITPWTGGELVPALQWPHAVQVYRRMGNEDGRASSVLQAIGLPIRRTVWRIDPNGARDEVVQHVSDDLGLPIKGQPEPEGRPRTRGRFSWNAHLQTALLMLQYGHQFFEQVYRIDEQGRARLRKLAPRPAETISAINVARDGGLVSIEQYGPDLAAGERRLVHDTVIPVGRLVAYVRDPEPGSWIGRSLLRPAYKHWLLKDELMRIQAAAARRNGVGVPVATAPEGEVDIDRYKRLASAYRGGDTAGVGLPHGASLALLGVQGNLPDIAQAIEYHDKQIALAGLAHFLNLDRGGSYALASVQADTFVQSVQSFAETIAETANAHVVEDLVDINFGEDEPAPRIVFEEIGTRKDAVASALKLLVDAGILFPDRSLEEAVRDDYGLPAKDSRPPAPAPVDASAAGAVLARRRNAVRISAAGDLTLF